MSSICARGASYENLGNNLLDLVKKHSISKIIADVNDLQMVEEDDVLTDEEVLEMKGKIIHSDHSRLTGEEDTWYDYLYQAQHDPEYLLQVGRYIDGMWSLEGEAEKFFLLNLDESSLDVYVWHSKTISNRKSIQEMVELVSYPLNKLPETIGNLEDDRWDYIRDWVREN